MNYQKTLEKLKELVHSEHVNGCEQNTCDVNISYENNFYLWAIYLFSGTGAGSKEFNKLYKSLPKKFEDEAEKERQEFVNSVPHVSCQYCNAVIWNPEEVNYYCDCCDKDIKNFLYVIDLNERGIFNARVTDLADKTLYRISNEESGSISQVDDGFMKNATDVSSLCDYLIKLEILPKFAKLKAMG